MTPTEITLIVGMIATIITSICIPWYLRWQSRKHKEDETEVVSWQSLTTAIQKERDQLRMELAANEDACRKKIRALEEDYDNRLTQARTRITQLEAEVSELYKRLYQRDKP